MNLTQLLDRLYRRQNLGMKMGLEVTQCLLRKMGNPERSFAAIHVAGSNGKGSVCAMLESVLRAAGVPTGLYTSPHLVRFNERLKVAGVDITDGELGALFEVVEPLVVEVAREEGREPTFFECTTAMAFEHFRRCGVKLTVVETGLGGRLDSTNVMMPVLSVITPITVEHTKYLGPDIPSIAREKAGIIKAGRPVVAAAMSEEALGVIRRVAAEQKSPLVEAAECASVTLKSCDLSGQKVTAETASLSFGTLRIPLIGRHQLGNLATVLAVLETLGDRCGLAIEPSVVKKGLEKVSWPGRFQVLSKEPPMILDGAHNPGGAAVLAEALGQVLKGRPVGLVFGMCDDKDIAGYTKALGRLVRRAWAVKLRTERSLPAESTAAACRVAGWKTDVEESVPVAIGKARQWALENGGAVCICGSLFLVGEVLEGQGQRGKGTNPENQ